MLKDGLYIVNKLEDNGFSAYIVGGAVRDFILSIDSVDIDICTNARVDDICRIFSGAIPGEFGNVIVKHNNSRFEITTFRVEDNYVNNRKPSSIKYVDNVEEDLYRRDFTMNTLLIDKNRKIIDYMSGVNDIRMGIIRSIGDANDKFRDDVLRILRAIRFATTLGFKLDNNVVDGINNNKKYLANLSYNRKKEELDKIFLSDNILDGIELLKRYGLDKELDLYDLDKIKSRYDLLGIWSIVDKNNLYPFSKNEFNIIKGVREIIDKKIDNNILYKYGLYICKIASDIRGEGCIVSRYNSLPIKSRSDIDISGDDILLLLGMGEGKYIEEIFVRVEEEIINSRLNNNKDDIINFIKIYYL